MSSIHTENVQNKNNEDKERTLVDKFLGAIIKTLFVVGSSALVLDSVRNSLTWYLGKFWGDAGSAWQEIWTNILAWVITFFLISTDRLVSVFNMFRNFEVFINYQILFFSRLGKMIMFY